MRRFVFIGFDAADYRVIQTLAARGSMPTFRRLMDTSASAVARSPYAFYVGAQWPSFYTGLNTAGHGRYCYRQLVPGTYDDRQVNADQIDGAPFWDVLGAQGRRFSIIDVPKTVVSDRFAGEHVVDWATHDTELLGMRTAPDGLRADILAGYGEGEERNCNTVLRTAEGFDAFRTNLIERLSRKERFIVDRLRRGDWDALVAVFADTHCAGHQLWHLHDPQHHLYDPALVDRVGDPLRDLYEAIDATLGRVLAHVPPDCIAMIFASHGIGPHWDGLHLMDDVLARLDTVLPHGQPPRASWLATKALRKAHRYGPASLGAHLPRPTSTRAFRKVFWVPNNECYLGLRINLEGREPLGRIRSSEFSSYSAAVMEALAELRVGPGGPPAFSEISLTTERLRGAHLDDLPDIVARWTRNGPFHALSSPRIGDVRGRYESVRTGDHQPDGLLLASGPGIQPGERPVCALEDLAPTFAALLDGTLPRGDGSALPWMPC